MLDAGSFISEPVPVREAHCARPNSVCRDTTVSRCVDARFFASPYCRRVLVTGSKHEFLIAEMGPDDSYHRSPTISWPHDWDLLSNCRLQIARYWALLANNASPSQRGFYSHVTNGRVGIENFVKESCDLSFP